MKDFPIFVVENPQARTRGLDPSRITPHTLLVDYNEVISLINEINEYLTIEYIVSSIVARMSININ